MVLALPVVALACGESGPRMEPVIAVPDRGTDGYPWDGVTDVVLSIARAGDPDDLATARGAPGESLALDDIEFADDLVLHLSGHTADLEVAYGRSCPFEVADGADPPQPLIYFA